MDQDTHDHHATPTPQQEYSRRRGSLRWEASAPIAIAMIATTWTALITGRGLAIYLGAPLLASLFVPFLTCGDHAFRRTVACSIGIALTLAAFNMGADVSFGEWFRCSVIITSLMIALAAITNLLIWVRIPGALAATATSIIALLWMTWPVWMSHSLTQVRVDWLVPAHPLLAINGVLQHLGSWDHAPIAYRELTILNQDIPFRLPTSIVPTTIVHLTIGALLLVPGLRRKARDSVEPPAHESVVS